MTAQAASYIGHSFFLERAFLYDIKTNAHFFPNMYNGGFDIAFGYEHREVNNKIIADPVQTDRRSARIQRSATISRTGRRSIPSSPK